MTSYLGAEVCQFPDGDVRAHGLITEPSSSAVSIPEACGEMSVHRPKSWVLTMIHYRLCDNISKIKKNLPEYIFSRTYVFYASYDNKIELFPSQTETAAQ